MTAPNPSLFVATPCYGGMAHAVFMQGLLALETACADRGVGLAIHLGGGDALVSRARAGAFAKFLASGATHLMFIDADIGFTPDQVFRLLDAGRDVVGGLYVRKTGSAAGTPEMEALSESTFPDPDGFQEVASIGAGFLLVSRLAAEQLHGSYQELRARLGDVHDAGMTDAAMLFEPMIDAVTGRYLADHEAFCRRWRTLGRHVWADTGSRLQHVHEMVLG